MFDTSCPSRDDPLKEYSILFPNKLNTQEFLYCAMEKYDLSICPGIRDARHQSFSASTQPSQTRHDRPKITDLMGRKTDSSKSARLRHYYLAKSARSRHYHLASDHSGMNDRQIYV